MANDNYKIIRYSPEYKSQVTALRNSVFGGGLAMNTKYFEWKYERNPYLKEPQFYLALHNGKVVGMMGDYGSCWRGGASPVSWIVPCEAELVVDPAHRRRGIASRLLNQKNSDLERTGYRDVINLSANVMSRQLFCQNDYELVATYTTYRHESSLRRFTDNHPQLRRLHVGRRKSVAFKRFDRWANQRQGSIYGAREPRISDMSELVSRNSDSCSIRHVRDATFYKWRLADPRSHYRFIFCDREDRLDGFLILQQSLRGGRTTIVDWESSSIETWDALISAAISTGAKSIAIRSVKFTREQDSTLWRLDFKLAALTKRNRSSPPGMFLKTLSHESQNDAEQSFHTAITSKNLDMRIICSDEF